MILPMIYRLAFGLLHILPTTFEFSIDGLSRHELLGLNLVVYCGPFLLFGLAGAWSLRHCADPISPKSRLVSFAGVAINAVLLFHQAYGVFSVSYGYA